ncbi:hypothetical protein HOC13_04485 [Candidatus Woesearchaeota archaeon]|jgi:hypothetical protein|nr:hypothetical protein [Candidatus Woesearchaeota archaeon]
MRNKKGWIKLAEAFISILIIGAILAFSVSSGFDSSDDFRLQIETQQNSLLNGIQLNESLRGDIISLSIPKESNEIGFPSLLNSSLSEINSVGLECVYKVCSANLDCSLGSEPVEKEIYAKSVIISSDRQIFNPRSLNLFCWEK